MTRTSLRPCHAWLLAAALALVCTAAPRARAELPAWCPSALEEEIADRINQERAARSLVPLRLDVRLVEAARLHSQDMASHNLFDHTGSNGSYFADRVSAAGYPWRAVGENIAAGYPTAAAVVAGWMGSPGHRAIILSTAYRHFGVGYAFGASTTYGHYYTADFGDTTSALQSPDDLCVEQPACSNGLDDDGDGRGDFPQDLECASANDRYETADCADGIDNDGDGRIDFGPGPTNDRGCPLDLGMFVEDPACNDGLDNDGDSRVDLADPHCAGRAWSNSETPGGPACGLGFEIAPLLVLLAGRRRRGTVSR